MKKILLVGTGLALLAGVGSRWRKCRRAARAARMTWGDTDPAWGRTSGWR